MGLLHLLSYAGALTGFLFVTLSLASGLLWLAELIEEHSRYAKVIGMRAIYTIIGLHIILIFTDSLPILPTLLSIFAHLIYLTNFSSTWPCISLTSPRFLASCVLVIADHFTWFFHFAAKANEAKRFRQPKYRYGSGYHGKDDSNLAFMDVAAFFASCVWFVPLFLFLSLSANDNALPSFDPASAPSSPSIGGPIDLSSPIPGGSQSHRQIRSRTSTSLVKSLLTPILSLLPRIRSSRSGRKNEEGIIAPRTPIRGSPLHSPVPLSSTSSYFPWGEDTTNPSSGGGTTSNYGNLTPEINHRKNTKTPPPPRRIVSEAATKGLNPRGLATRNGIPAVMGGTGGSGDLATKGLEPRRSPRPGPKMSLGPRGGQEDNDGFMAGLDISVDHRGPLKPVSRKDD